MGKATSSLPVLLFALFIIAAIVGAGVAEWWQYERSAADPAFKETTLELLQYLGGGSGVATALVLIGWLIAAHVSRPAMVVVTVNLCLFGYLNTLFLLSFMVPLRLLATSQAAPFWLVTVVVIYLNLAVYAHLLSLCRPRLRPKPYLYLVSFPATAYYSCILLAIPILWVVLLIPSGYASLLLVIPAALSLLGLWQSLSHKLEVFDLDLRSSTSFPTLKRLPSRPAGSEGEGLLAGREEGEGDGHHQSSRSLKIVQITDPHVGPFVSVQQLRSLCQQVVQHNPDLVLLTGDFFTLEGEQTLGALASALAPLKPLQGRLFACLGNHDVESKVAREATDRELREAAVTLLVDQEAIVEIPGRGKVQVVGVDYYPKKTRGRVIDICRTKLPRRDDCPMRVVMLHDPAGFRLIDPDDRSLVFSGHTHGGQIGLVNFGLLDWTLAGLVGPANGLWAHGTNRNYIGRGQGCRFLFGNFLVRLGVPPETSVITFKW